MSVAFFIAAALTGLMAQFDSSQYAFLWSIPSVGCLIVGAVLAALEDIADAIRGKP